MMDDYENRLARYLQMYDRQGLGGGGGMRQNPDGTQIVNRDPGGVGRAARLMWAERMARQGESEGQQYGPDFFAEEEPNRLAAMQPRQDNGIMNRLRAMMMDSPQDRQMRLARASALPQEGSGYVGRPLTHIIGRRG